jgi:hypothetical protein
MDEKIYDANDKAKEEGAVIHPSIRDMRSRIVYWSQKMGKPWNGKVCGGPVVVAFIENGRWLGQCECGNIEYATPEDAIFFCNLCGNIEQGFRARPVKFPEEIERQAIEAALLKRPIIVDERIPFVNFPTQKAAAAAPKIPGLRRDWRPGMKGKDLAKQNKEAGL